MSSKNLKGSPIGNVNKNIVGSPPKSASSSSFGGATRNSPGSSSGANKPSSTSATTTTSTDAPIPGLKKAKAGESFDIPLVFGRPAVAPRPNGQRGSFRQQPKTTANTSTTTASSSSATASSDGIITATTTPSSLPSSSSSCAIGGHPSHLRPPNSASSAGRRDPNAMMATTTTITTTPTSISNKKTGSEMSVHHPPNSSSSSSSPPVSPPVGSAANAAAKQRKQQVLQQQQQQQQQQSLTTTTTTTTLQPTLPVKSSGKNGGGGDNSDDDENNNGGGGGGAANNNNGNKNSLNNNEDDDDEDSNFIYDAPPNVKGTWYFPEDGILFDSNFDSGNLMKVERRGTYRYDLYTAPDCALSPKQTGNKQWFYFSIAGGMKGTAISMTLISLPSCKMYSFGYSPCYAIVPFRTSFTRMTNRPTTMKLDAPVLWPPPPQPPQQPSLSSGATPTSVASSSVTPSAAWPTNSGGGGGGVFGVSNTTTTTTSSSSSSVMGAIDAYGGGGGNNNNTKNDDGNNFPQPPPPPPTTGKSPVYINMTIDYIFEYDSMLKDISQLQQEVSGNSGGGGGHNFHLSGSYANMSTLAKNDANNYTSIVYFANAHPYSYSKLQRHLASWNSSVNGPFPCTMNLADAEASSGNIYFHRELLTRTLDGHRCDLVTISSRKDMAVVSNSGSSASAKEEAVCFEPMLEQAQLEGTTSSGKEETGGTKKPSSRSNSIPIIPTPEELLQIQNQQPQFLYNPNTGILVTNSSPVTNRARRFPRKQYVVLSARVHPGEIPASHILHGIMEFLQSRSDPRAIALRDNFVFVIVPMINPDGVVRGHSRADPLGQNLNRKYPNPSPKRHPTAYALKKLLLTIQSTGKLALYIDIHAHANKKGMFFYGNAMDAKAQIQNVLYAKLVSLNTPFFDFPGSNFSEANMVAVGKNGESKDGSSRVTLFKETGFVHSYTLEANYVTGPPVNGVAGLNSIPGEEGGWMQGATCPKYTYSSFHDCGRALVVSLLDLHNINPTSRLPATNFNNLRGVCLWVQRAIIIDAWEQHRRLAIYKTGLSISRQNNNGGGAGVVDPSSSASCGAAGTGLTATQLASESSLTSMMKADLFHLTSEPITTRPSKVFPPTTTYHLSLVAADIAASEKEKASSSKQQGLQKGGSGVGLRRNTGTNLRSAAKK